MTIAMMKMADSSFLVSGHRTLSEHNRLPRLSHDKDSHLMQGPTGDL